MIAEVGSKWKGLVVTCPNQAFAAAATTELNQRVKLGLFPEDVVRICISDPKEGYGSGGATINALLSITEHLSAKSGYTVLSADALVNAHIIIMHMGRNFPYDACGRGFVTLPFAKKVTEQSFLLTNFDLLIHTITKQLGANSPPGVWVCSSDMILQVPEDFILNWNNFDSDSAYCMATKTDYEYASKHGVFKTNDDKDIEDIFFQYTKKQLINEGVKNPLLVTGIIFFPTNVAERILNLHIYTPITSSTYLGLDNGCNPIQISLFFDIILCMAKGISKEGYLARSKLLEVDHNSYSMKKSVCNILWETLNTINVKTVTLVDVVHHYLSINNTPNEFNVILQKPLGVPGYVFSNQCHSFIEDGADIGENCVIVNSLIGKDVKVNNNCHVTHCNMKGRIVIGKNCVLFGVSEADFVTTSGLSIPDDSFIMGVNIQLPAINNYKVFTCLNIGELKQHADAGDATKESLKGHMSDLYKHANIYHNEKHRLIKSRLQFLNTQQFPITDLNGNVNLNHLIELYLNTSAEENNQKILRNTWKLSFMDIISHAKIASEFNYRRNLFDVISCEKIVRNLLNNKRESLQPLLVSNKSQTKALKAIERVFENCPKEYIFQTSTRAFFLIADILNMMAGTNAGLRSGPAGNKEWSEAFLLLNEGKIIDGAKELRKVQHNWMQNPLRLIRAARHYEGAGQILIRKCCMTVADQINFSKAAQIDWDTWIVCETSARLDLSGGWSDTPPICYENGGAVVNIALKISGKRPIGAKIRRISKPVIRLVEVAETGQLTHEMECSCLQDFKDYNQPTSPGALLKACFVLTEVVDIKSSKNLQDQLLERYSGGFEIQTWANLPRGSGMGTSSILAGAILQAIYKAIGKDINRHSLIHSVLLVEQMLTTGGGWQDQVGGIIGGVKICRSLGKLPLTVMTETVVCPPDFLKKLQNHILLIYTGKTRLARNLLQEALRNWYACEENILRNCKHLVNNAETCKEAFKKGDMASIGRCLTKYWSQKKIMAPGCEPTLCSAIMKALEPYVFGQSLAGAGGGGFLFAITKTQMEPSHVKEVLRDLKGSSHIVVYETSIDLDGMQVYKQTNHTN